jgi:hypothetical protein
MAAALEGASERQHMVVAEDLNGHKPRGHHHDHVPAAHTRGPWDLGPGRAGRVPLGTKAAGAQAVQAASGVLPLARTSGHGPAAGGGMIFNFNDQVESVGPGGRNLPRKSESPRRGPPSH